MKKMLLLLAAFCLILLLFAPACQQPESTNAGTSTLNNEQSQAQTTSQPAVTGTKGTDVSWKADGVISPGEYTNSKTYGDYQISYFSNDEFVYIGIIAKTEGWIAVGFGAESRMKNADIIEGFIKDGKLNIYDMFSTGDFGPHTADTQQGGTDDVLTSGGKVENGNTTIEFKRRLDTGDKYDRPLKKGTNTIIWAYAAEPQVFLKHMSRGHGEIEIE